MGSGICPAGSTTWSDAICAKRAVGSGFVPQGNEGEAKRLPSGPMDSARDFNAAGSLPEKYHDCRGGTAIGTAETGLRTLLESLAQGVPQVAIPVTVDQASVCPRIAEKNRTVSAIKKVDRCAPFRCSFIRYSVSRPIAVVKPISKKVIAENNGLSVAADLVEESLQVPTKAAKW